MAAEIKNFLFSKNSEEKDVLILALSDRTNREVIIEGGYSDEEMKIIHDINRRHIMKVFEEKLHTDGCLPSACIGVDKPSVNISPRYLMHCFVNIMELLFKTNENVALFARDKDIISLPTSNDNLEKIMMAMTSTVDPSFLSSSSSSSSSYMDVEEGDINNNNNNDNNNIHFTVFLRVLVEKMFSMQRNLKEMISKNTNKINRKASTIGGINYAALMKNNEEVDILSSGLQECSNVIHDVIQKNAKMITRMLLDTKDTSMVAMKEVIKIYSQPQQQQQPLYANLNISFELMYKCIGEVFNVLFFNIIPQKSMMEAMQGSFYNAAVLSELNLLERYNDILCRPILYRLIHSCFKDESFLSSSSSSSSLPQEDDDVHEKYLDIEYRGVLTQIEKLERGGCRKNWDDEILGRIAIKSITSIRDKQYIEALYWVLNRKRSYTFEYYIILMSVLYINARCPNVNNATKLSNVLKFIIPVYSIMKLFHQYVTKLGIENSLCSATMDTFSTIYQRELKDMIENFSESIK